MRCGVLGGLFLLGTAVVGDGGKLFEWRCAGFVRHVCVPLETYDRCTNVSNLFYFGMTLYMFRTVIPSIIRSSRLYIQQQAFVKQILLTACCLLANRQQYLFNSRPFLFFSFMRSFSLSFILSTITTTISSPHCFIDFLYQTVYSD